MKKKRKSRRDGIYNRKLVVRAAGLKWSPARIARHYGLSLRTVQKHLFRAGIVSAPPLENRKEVQRLATTYGVTEAARQLGVSRQAIYLRLAAWGVK